ncbi:hypothetical protein N7470_009490 [Penicillium chermesinum]|nr:hypothetical protein N7470_009490 [Penicillium chermesinum]
MLVRHNTTVINHQKHGTSDLPSVDIESQNAFKQEVFRQSIALARSRMNEATELRCAIFKADGSVQSAETRLTKADVASRFGLNARDLRNLDLVSEGIPHILVRPSAIFMSIFTLRLIIQPDQVVLFLLDSENGGVKLQDIFEHDLQNRISSAPVSGPTSLPYELRVVDAALASVTAVLEAEHLILKEDVKKNLRESRNEDFVFTALRALLENGNTLVAIEQRARGVRSAMQELLSNDDDMATMYLSDNLAGKPHAIQDHQEVEYLLEAYYKNADAIAESANALAGEVRRTAGAIKSTLDVRRNQIMVFEAQLEIWMLGFAVSTFIAGLLGMNVVNYMEESSMAFALLASGCVVATFVMSRLGMRRLKKMRSMTL